MRSRWPLFPIVWLAAAFVAGPARPAQAQLSMLNLLEAQIGNYPFIEPTSRLDLYDRLHLEYGFEGGRVGARFEFNQNSQNENSYESFTQRYVVIEDESFKLRAGNFYTLLGRGLVHRSFELPGVVLDQLGIRSRYAPSRDADGVMLEGRRGGVEALLMLGRPNNGQTSPADEEFGFERYSGTVAGGQISARLPLGIRVGASHLRYNPSGGVQQELGSGFVDFDPMRLAGVEEVAFPLYVEYAALDAKFGDWWKLRTGDATPHALYLGSNLLWGPASLSAEWKDYQGFLLGINDPPSLVREHSWKLLNRGTHVLEADSEEGFQLEGSVAWPGWGSVVLNFSRADGDLPTPARFDEKFVEVRVAPEGASWEASTFYDRAKDQFDGLVSRDVAGVGGILRMPRHYSVTIDGQYQDVTRAPSRRFSEHFYSIAVARAGWGTIAFQRERTNDPFQQEPDDFAVPGVQPRSWNAVVIQGRISSRNEATLFYGERRGGLACTAGTCYLVQDFEGLELRLTTRL